MTLATAALLGAAVLGGCSDDAGGGEPTTTSAAPTSASPSPSPTASPSASPTGPVVPEAAKANTEAGARAFLAFFADTVNQAWSTPKLGLIPTISDPACKFCEQLEATSKQLADKKQRVAGPAVEFVNLTPRDGAPAGQIFFSGDLRGLRVDVVDASGSKVDVFEAATGKSLFGVRWTEQGWVLLDVEEA